MMLGACGSDALGMELRAIKMAATIAPSTRMIARVFLPPSRFGAFGGSTTGDVGSWWAASVTADALAPDIVLRSNAAVLRRESDVSVRPTVPYRWLLGLLFPHVRPAGRTVLFLPAFDSLEIFFVLAPRFTRESADS